MFIAFRTFRKIILGIILLASSGSLGLSLFLRPFFNHPNSAYVMIGILVAIVHATILSMSRKTIFGSPQSVATESLGTFTLLPFALILALYALSVSVTPEPSILLSLAALQILVFVSTIIHTLYAAGLISTAMFTVCAFDRDVWSRDIDSSPSPFPMSLLFWFICPCFSRPASNPFPTEGVHQSVCLPGCNCSITKTQVPDTPETNPCLEPTPQMSMLSSRSLVRVPNDVERRTSIVIAFEV
ncbi:hypothetical protein C8R43DRAFT_689291 [Mycena crocata]|nr:hypothetical protein C8R43DRAFT_689291 [Mycena crocata]